MVVYFSEWRIYSDICPIILAIKKQQDGKWTTTEILIDNEILKANMNHYLRAAFSKNQTDSDNFDSDVGKNHPKSYILFITFVKHPIQLFFSTPLRFRFVEDQSFGALTLFSLNFVGIAFDWSNWEFLMVA